MRQLILMLALLPLAGCTIATSEATADTPATSPTSCHSEAITQFTGQTASQDLGERIVKASGARILRWVPKGGVVTMDFNPERITVQLDSSNRVEQASCG